MAKYYIVLFVILGIVLFYIFLQDPCNNMARADFANEHPGYEILDSVAGEGSPEKVQCHIYYKKPDSERIYEDVWLYQKSVGDWSLSSILETGKQEETP
jgi:hypothetical protein